VPHRAVARGAGLSGSFDRPKLSLLAGKKGDFPIGQIIRALAIRYLLTVTLFCVGTASGWNHEFWIAPEAFRIEPESKMPLQSPRLTGPIRSMGLRVISRHCPSALKKLASM
jgi:hypothetical protein